jgi:DNA-binding MarR family transcriptional regulator
MSSGVIAAELRRQVQAFVRSFGLLSQSQTPCGKPLGLSHAHALMLLLEHARVGSTAVQSDLARALGIDKSNVARLCQRMEDAGHLMQAPHPEDGRARCLELTAQGARVARDVERSSLARFSALAERMSRAECQKVTAALRTLNQAVTALTSPIHQESMT